MRSEREFSPDSHGSQVEEVTKVCFHALREEKTLFITEEGETNFLTKNYLVDPATNFRRLQT